jgi:hypothetical protein
MACACAGSTSVIRLTQRAICFRAMYQQKDDKPADPQAQCGVLRLDVMTSC